MNSDYKRNILMITPYLPCHSQSGGQTRSFFLIKHLSLTNNITLICFTRDQKGLEELKLYCRRVIIVKRGKTWDLNKILRTGFSWYPFLISNYISSQLKSQIEHELSTRHYDLIHTECFYLMPNIPKTNIPIVLVDQTIEYAVYQHYVESLKFPNSLLKPLLWIDVLKLKYWEGHYWRTTHTLAAVSADDQKLMANITGRTDIKIILNGVDEIFTNPTTISSKTSKPSILFGVSNMRWMQNSEGVELLLADIWPKIKSAIPTAQLYIIGRYAPTTFSRINNPDIIIREAEDNGSANDPVSYYQRCWILLAPIKSGGGSRTKFFEAMACKLPIITTKHGIEGMSVQNNKQVVICDYHQLAATAIKYLKNRKLRNYVGQQASLLVKNKYSWQESAKTLNLLYHQVINGQ